MPLNGGETWKGSERSDKHYHILHFGALPDAPLEHPHEGEGVGQRQANLPSIYSWKRKKKRELKLVPHRSFCQLTNKIPLSCLSTLSITIATVLLLLPDDWDYSKIEKSQLIKKGY